MLYLCLCSIRISNLCICSLLTEVTCLKSQGITDGAVCIKAYLWITSILCMYVSYISNPLAWLGMALVWQIGIGILLYVVNCTVYILYIHRVHTATLPYRLYFIVLCIRRIQRKFRLNSQRFTFVCLLKHSTAIYCCKHCQFSCWNQKAIILLFIKTA